MLDKKKILIVEDEAIHAMYLNMMLKKTGYEITGTEATGADSISSVEANCPDLILMDINLRNSIDGIELATILRKKYSFPIIFVSGFDDTETLNRIKPIENSWKLTKPVQEVDLITSIAEALEPS